MHLKWSKRSLYHGSRTVLLCIILALLFIGEGKNGFAYGEEKEVAFNKDQNIKIENKQVEAGVPLKVIGVQQGEPLQWTLTAANGSESVFTTTTNSYTPSERDLEKLITVKVLSDKTNKVSIYYSKLPVIYMNNYEGYYGVGDDYSEAFMHMQGNHNFTNKCVLYDGDVDIRLRGNSTRNRDKRPFHIKLDTKADLLGMGKNKNWALLANDIDHTLMRNKLLYDFSGAIGMDTYMKSENVVLIFNDEYYGVYQLCETVDIGKDRVDIYDWEKSAGDAAKAIVKALLDKGDITKGEVKTSENNLKMAMSRDLSWMSAPFIFTYDVNGNGVDENYKITDYIKLPTSTGGALMEMDFFAFDGSNPSTVITNYSQPIYFKSPEFAITNEAFYNYINQYIQSFEYALHSTDFTYHDDNPKFYSQNRRGGNKNPGYKIGVFMAPEFDGKHYSELFDMDSLVQNFLVCEYSMNWDGMKNSVFMYKDTDGLFRIGPEWDFDWAWGNLNMYQRNTWYPTSWQTTEKAFVKEQYYQTVQWNRCLIRDPYFILRVYEKYKQIRGTVIEDMIKLGGTIDTYVDELKEAASANDTRWDYTYKEYKSVGFTDSIASMKKFIMTRVKWMDKQFASLDKLVASLGYYRPDHDLKIIKVDSKTVKGFTEVTAKITDPQIASVVFQVNGTSKFTSEVISGKAVCKIPNADLASDPQVLNVVQISAIDKEGNYIISSKEEGNYTEAKSNYTAFYSDFPVMGTTIVKKEGTNPVSLPLLLILTVGFIILIVIISVWIGRNKKKNIRSK